MYLRMVKNVSVDLFGTGAGFGSLAASSYVASWGPKAE